MSLTFYAYGNAGKIYVDIDGPNKGKNEWNNDQFDFSVQNPRDNDTIFLVIPDHKSAFDNKANGHRPAIESGATNIGYGATWIIEYGNMDYLKCPEQLQWGGQTSCN